jgi:hypothetical protein
VFLCIMVAHMRGITANAFSLPGSSCEAFCARPLLLLPMRPPGSTQVMVVASQVLAGHLGTTELAAAAVGNLFWLLGFYTIIGCATGVWDENFRAVFCRTNCCKCNTKGGSLWTPSCLVQPA